MGVPLKKYWQNKHNIPLFHPMLAGEWLYNNPSIENLIELEKLSETLPNKGVAWYYPDKYDVLRMKNVKVYSCIKGYNSR